jgi:hypothetical protein
MWTALPRGFTKPDARGNQKLKLTVFVSPRLETTTPMGYLGDFPDFSSGVAGTNWASIAGSMSFAVEMREERAPSVRSYPAKVVSAKPDAVLWDQVFGPQMPIKQFAFKNLAAAAINSYSSKAVFNTIKTQYLNVAKAPELTFELPTVMKLVNLPDVAKLPLINVLPTPLLRRSGTISAMAAAPSAPVQDVQFTKFQQFHKPYAVPESFVKPPIPPMDFHKGCTAIGNYPALNRRLGLAIDIEVPYNAQMARAGRVRIKPTWADGRAKQVALPHPAGGTYAHRDVTQWTAIDLTHAMSGAVTKFMAKSRDGYVRDGYLVARSVSNPSKDPAQLYNVDVDVAAARFMSTAVQAAELIDIQADPVRISALAASATATPESALSNEKLGLPSLGQPVIRYAIGDLPSRVKKQNEIFKQFNDRIVAGTEDQNVNFAEDLNRGYRIDVWDSVTRQWHPLCARVGTYSIADAPIAWDSKPSITDEGWIQLSGVSAPEDVLADDPPSEMRIQEGLFDWSGWSLSVPRPGGSLQEPDEYGNTAVIKTVKDDNGVERPLGHTLHPELPLDVRFSVPAGTLPRLRFGTTYRFRARAVDLAGNGLAFSEGSTTADPGGTGDKNELVSRAIVHKRYDPVKPPDVIMADSAKPSESPYYLVVRSFTDPGDGLYKTQNTLRHITPPRIAVSSAEALGGLDKLAESGRPMDSELWQELGERDKFDWPMDENGLQVPQPTVPSPVRYLPDLYSRGTAFSGLPGVGERVAKREIGAGAVISGVKIRVSSTKTVTTTSMRVAFEPPTGKRWYEKLPFDLSVSGIAAIDTRIPDHDLPAMPAWNETQRILGIELPKAEELVVSMSSYANPADLAWMGVYQWGLEAHLPELTRVFTPAISKISAAAAAPSSAVANAVPVKAKAALPAIANTLINTALIGQNWLLTPGLDLTMVHAVDKPLIKPEFTTRAHYERRKGETHATLVDWMPIHGKSTSKFEVKAAWTENIDDPTAGAPKWGPTAVSKAAAAFTLTPEKAQERILGFGKPLPTMKPTVWGVIPTGGMLVDDGGTDTAPQRQFFGDTKHRKLNVTATATSRFEKYFNDLDITDFTETSAAKSLHVPSSARPPRPDVKYILPTFGWTRASGTSTRGGGGLRVYLDRPWFSSGDDERLAVVLYQQKPGDAGYAQLDPFTSKWGKDPLFAAPDLPATRMSLSHFKETSTKRYNLNLREYAGSPVMIAAYEVDYDAATGLWFADVVIDPGKAYFPFVKLALARYQPYALTDCELSPVVIADFVQLTPDRIASAVLSSDKSEVTVSVTGQSYTDNDAATGSIVKPTVTVTIERANTRGDAVTGWTPITSETELTRQASTVYQLIAGDTRTTWRDAISLKNTTAGSTYRVVVREYEHFAKYQSTAKTPRLVYVEALPLSL